MSWPDVALSRTVAKPQSVASFEARGPNAIHTMKQIASGTTRLLLACDKCGRTEVQVVLGVPEDEPQ